jgi:uncharacterized membrane protein (UPF0182 family)
LAYQNRVLMRETFEAGLEGLFGGGVPSASSSAARRVEPATVIADAPDPQPLSGSPLISQAREHYDRAIAAQRAGDWAAYGREIKALGEILQRLNPPTSP